jgi:hypothetical protein
VQPRYAIKPQLLKIFKKFLWTKQSFTLPNSPLRMHDHLKCMRDRPST